MKKTTSFHLEQDILDEIEEYKNKYGLSSRNVALERMLLERRNILSFQGFYMNNENKKSMINDSVINENIKDKFSKGIEQGYSDMPD